MSSLLTSPKVTVFVGDGVKFLSEHEATYDVIITDTSDPVGPGEALFQRPYFQLIYNALNPGGNTIIQAETPWLILPVIAKLRNMTSTVFPVTEYAFTTVPSYPSGQIGFVICSKNPNRDVKIPLREIGNTKYYNGALHRSAFVVPEFCRVMIEQTKNIMPKFGRAAAADALQGQKKRKVLLLGSGFVARPCAEYIVRNPLNELTVGLYTSLHFSALFFSYLRLTACRTLASAESLASGLPDTTAISLDVNSSSALDAQVAQHDVVVSLIPYTHHAAVIKSAIKGKTNVVTTSYVSPAMKELDAEAKKAGIIVMNEVGLDPGIDHLYAIKTINEVHEKGGKVSYQRFLQTSFLFSDF
jgi:hypothetical protein